MPKTYGRNIYNILLIGNVGAGKSSLANSICTVADDTQDDEILHPAQAQRTDGTKSITFKVTYSCLYPVQFEPVRSIAFMQDR